MQLFAILFSAMPLCQTDSNFAFVNDGFELRCLYQISSSDTEPAEFDWTQDGTSVDEGTGTENQAGRYFIGHLVNIAASVSAAQF